jgi:hypothetical protein
LRMPRDRAGTAAGTHLDGSSVPAPPSRTTGNTYPAVCRTLMPPTVRHATLRGSGRPASGRADDSAFGVDVYCKNGCQCWIWCTLTPGVVKYGSSAMSSSSPRLSGTSKIIIAPVSSAKGPAMRTTPARCRAASRCRWAARADSRSCSFVNANSMIHMPARYVPAGRERCIT